MLDCGLDTTSVLNFLPLPLVHRWDNSGDVKRIDCLAIKVLHYLLLYIFSPRLSKLPGWVSKDGTINLEKVCFFFYCWYIVAAIYFTLIFGLLSGAEGVCRKSVCGLTARVLSAWGNVDCFYNVFLCVRVSCINKRKWPKFGLVLYLRSVFFPVMACPKHQASSCDNEPLSIYLSTDSFLMFTT